MDELTIADVTLVELEDGGLVKHGKRRMQETRLVRFNVHGPDGNLLGRVERRMATFERKTRGRMYVNSRWHSPRWFYSLPYPERSPFEFTSRKKALEALLSDWRRR